jgi:DNA polymerase III epsilon subunit family exonuclease
MEYANKGQLIQGFVSTYVAFDLETTGVNIYRDEIIEIGAIKVIDGDVVDTFSELVKPSVHIPFAASNVNGITDEMVRDSDPIEPVLKRFLDFIEDYTLLGHNIYSFDLNFICGQAENLLGKTVNNNFIDTLYIAKNNICDVDNYRLSTLCNHFNIYSSVTHRSLADCYMSVNLYHAMKQHLKDNDKVSFGTGNIPSPKKYRGVCNYTDETKSLQILQGFLLGVIADDLLTDEEIISLKKWMDANICLKGNYPFDRVFSCLDKVLEDGEIESSEKDELLELFQHFVAPVSYKDEVQTIDFERSEFCLTGNFEMGTKGDIEQIIANKNGMVAKTVKKTVSYLIVGGKGSPDWKNGTYGGKIKKALEMQESGSSIKIIAEEQFIKLIKE